MRSESRSHRLVGALALSLLLAAPAAHAKKPKPEGEIDDTVVEEIPIESAIFVAQTFAEGPVSMVPDSVRCVLTPEGVHANQRMAGMFSNKPKPGEFMAYEDVELFKIGMFGEYVITATRHKGYPLFNRPSCNLMRWMVEKDEDVRPVISRELAETYPEEEYWVYVSDLRPPVPGSVAETQFTRLVNAMEALGVDVPGRLKD